MKAADKREYERVRDRADGTCEGCGERSAEQMHHRRFRSRGGKHVVANLVHICHLCHGRAHGPNPPAGWAISQYEQHPDHLIPFQAFDGLSWLTKDGRRVLVGDPGDTPY